MVSPISWTVRQVANLTEAVNIYNTEVMRMRRLGFYDFTPNLTSFEEERKRITNRYQLRTRINQLMRITRDDADKIVDSHGYSVPNYLKKEIQYTKRSVNNERRKMREKILGVEFDEDDVVYFTQLSGKNLADIHDGGYSGEDLEDLLNELFPDMKGYADLYVALVEDNMPGYWGEEIKRIITELAEKRPEALRAIFESNYEETEISYIYPEKPLDSKGRKRSFKVSGKEYEYKKGSPNLMPQGERYRNVYNFWANVANAFLFEDNYVERIINFTYL